MNTQKMSDNHILNAIRYWKRHLNCKPEANYMGMSDVGEDCCEQENRRNDEIEKEVITTIKKLEKEVSLRGVK